MADFIDISEDASEFDDNANSSESDTERMPVVTMPKRKVTRKIFEYYTESDQSDIDDEVRDKTFEMSESSEGDDEENNPEVVSMDENNTEVVSIEENNPEVVSIEENNPEVVSMEENNPEVVSIEENRHESSDSDVGEINIEEITQLFVKKIRKYAISQRQAAKLILKCSQSNLSEAIAKSKKLKTSKNITPRGISIYNEMKEWLDSPTLQREIQQRNAQQRMCKPQRQKRVKSGAGKGTQLSFVQICVLVELYKKDNRPSKQRKTLISETLGLDESQVSTWFNNQRARNFPAEKQVQKMKKDGQQPVIPQAWDSLLM